MEERNEGKQGSLMVARKGCTEKPLHCCCDEPSSIKEDPDRKVTSRKTGPTKAGRTGWWLVRAGSSLLSSMLRILAVCVFLLLLLCPRGALHCNLRCCSCCSVKGIIPGQLNGHLSVVPRKERPGAEPECSVHSLWLINQSLKSRFYQFGPLGFQND